MGKPVVGAGGAGCRAAVPATPVASPTAMASASAEAGRGWRAAAAALAVGLAALLLMFGGTVAATASTWWNTGSYNHGMLIVPVVLALVWERRAALARTAPRPTAWGLTLVVLASLAWTLGSAVSALIVQQFALVGMIWGMVLTVTGWRACWQMAFPLAYLVFAVPFGDFLVVHLQDITAWMTVGLLRASNVPVFSDGVFLQTAFGQFEVAEACSGLRFLTACLAFGTLFAWQFYTGWVHRLVFVIASAVVPVVANGVRAYGIVMLTDVFGPAVARDVDHIVYGWVFFSFVMALMAGVGWLFRQPLDTSLPPASAPRRHVRRAVAAATVLALLAGAAMPGWLALGTIRDAHASGRIAVPLVLSVPAGWAAAAPRDWTPRFAGADQVVHDGFAASGARLERVAAWWPNQEQGREVVNRSNDLSGPGWQRLSSGRVRLTVDGTEIEARETRLVNPAQERRIVWSWYWVDGAFTGDDRLAKLLQARALLFGNPDAGALIAVSAEYDDPLDEPAVLGAMRAFIAGHRGLSGQLARAADGTPALAGTP
ncbi:exosortase A [Caenispirillum bisanense]|uniref:exosortase A n=1 Tax=Caenispirillum bisanense TaxID=414052 RepID=UPI0031D4CB72